MTLQLISGGGLFVPCVPIHRFPTAASAIYSGSVIDATGEKFAFIGQVWFPGRTGTKDIQTLQFRFGTVVKAGGSGLTVSLQDVSTSANPSQPDETQDQTVAIANGNTSFASNTWITTGNLSANRTVSHGDWVAVVIEFDGSGRLGSDSVQITTIITDSGAIGQGGPVLKTASWAVPVAFNNIALGFSDGSCGTLGQPNISAFAISAQGVHTFASSSTPDEYAMRIYNPYKCKVDGGWMLCGPVSTAADFDIILYDGTTALATASIDAHRVSQVNTSKLYPFVFSSEVELAANTAYYLAMKPTTTTSGYLIYVDVASAALMDLMPGGQAYHQASRTDAGAWSFTTTRRPLCGLHVSSVSDDASGGSTVIVIED